MMTESDSLEKFVRKVDPTTARKVGRDESTFYLDRQRRSLVGKPRLFSRRTDIVAYRVHPMTDLEWRGPVCEVVEFGPDLALRVASRFLLSLPLGGRAKLVEFLAGGEPEEALSAGIRRWFGDYLRSIRDRGGRPLRDFFRIRAGLVEELRKSLLRESGLEAQVELRVIGEEDLGPRTLRTQAFFLRPKDTDLEFSISLRLDLRVSGEDRALAVAQRGRSERLEASLTEATRDFFAREVRLMEFRTELDTSVRPRLQQALGARVEEFGEQIDYLHLEATVPPKVESTREFEESVSSSIKGTSEKISVANTLRLSLQDAALWHRHGAGTIKEWCRKTLHEVVADELFETDYLTLLLDFETKIRDRIKTRFEREAARVGYAVRHHLVLPEVEPLRLGVEGFKIETGEVSYATEDTRHEVALGLYVTGRIGDLEEIKGLLVPGADIEGEIRREIESVTEEILHRASPERFYLEFKTTPDGRPSLVDELREAIRGSLQSKFDARDLSITPKMVETHLTKRITELSKAHREFELEFKPLQAECGIDSVRYRVVYEVLGIALDGWHKFLARDYGSVEEELSAVDRVLTELLREGLEALKPGNLDYNHPLGLAQVKTFANRRLDEIAEVFGLAIRLIALGRERTDLEEQITSTHRRKLLSAAEADSEIGELGARARVKEHRTLMARKIELLEQGAEADDPELESIETRLARIAEEATVGTPDQGRRLLEGSTARGPAGEFADLDGMLQLASPEEPESRRQGDEKTAELDDGQ